MAGSTATGGTPGTPPSTATPLITNTASATITVPLTPTVSHADPLVFLQGGPGETLLGALGPARDELSTAIVQKRPLIFFDQRGVGCSRPSLSCPLNLTSDYPFAIDQLTTLGSVTRILQQVRQCHDRLASQGVDLNAFNTAAGDFSLLSIIADGVYAASRSVSSPISAGAYLSIRCGEGGTTTTPPEVHKKSGNVPRSLRRISQSRS